MIPSFPALGFPEKRATIHCSTSASTGVEVFFATGPTNGVTVVNPTGYGTYTATNQPFFRYANQALGADSILSPDETSSGIAWKFAGNGATYFSFTVYVQTQIPATPYRVHLDRLTAEFHACGLDYAGTAYCWGDNTDAQLGIGSVAVRPEVPGPVVMPAGVHFRPEGGHGSRMHLLLWTYHLEPVEPVFRKTTNFHMKPKKA